MYSSDFNCMNAIYNIEQISGERKNKFLLKENTYPVHKLKNTALQVGSGLISF